MLASSMMKHLVSQLKYRHCCLLSVLRSGLSDMLLLIQLKTIKDIARIPVTSPTTFPFSGKLSDIYSITWGT